MDEDKLFDLEMDDILPGGGGGCGCLVVIIVVAIALGVLMLLSLIFEIEMLFLMGFIIAILFLLVRVNLEGKKLGITMMVLSAVFFAIAIIVSVCCHDDILYEIREASIQRRYNQLNGFSDMIYSDSVMLTTCVLSFIGSIVYFFSGLKALLKDNDTED